MSVLQNAEAIELLKAWRLLRKIPCISFALILFSYKHNSNLFIYRERHRSPRTLCKVLDLDA